MTRPRPIPEFTAIPLDEIAPDIAAQFDVIKRRIEQWEPSLFSLNRDQQTMKERNK